MAAEPRSHFAQLEGIDWRREPMVDSSLLTCGDCGQRFSDLVSCLVHEPCFLRTPFLKSHRNDCFTCPLCPDSGSHFATDRLWRLRYHLRLKHDLPADAAKSAVVLFHCRHCGFKSEKKRELAIHLENVHYGARCPVRLEGGTVCAQFFSCRSLMEQHVKDKHPGRSLHQCAYCAAGLIVNDKYFKNATRHEVSCREKRRRIEERGRLMQRLRLLITGRTPSHHAPHHTQADTR